jgi:hypothetical protein
MVRDSMRAFLLVACHSEALQDNGIRQMSDWGSVATGSSISWHTAEAAEATCEDFLYWYSRLSRVDLAESNAQGAPGCKIGSLVTLPHSIVNMAGTQIEFDDDRTVTGLGRIPISVGRQ